MIEYELIIHVDKRPECLSRVLREFLNRSDVDPVDIHVEHGSRPCTLAKLLGGVRAPYVMYMPDDHLFIRTPPIKLCLDAMEQEGIHHIAFDHYRKQGWISAWTRNPYTYAVGGKELTLAISDHWHIPTPGLWRVSQVRPVCEHVGESLKWVHFAHAQNGGMRDITDPDFVTVEDISRWRDPDHRANTVKTFLCGVAGTRYVKNLSAAPEEPDDV